MQENATIGIKNATIGPLEPGMGRSYKRKNLHCMELEFHALFFLIFLIFKFDRA